MNWMTIPAMIGPTMGPVVGGVLTSYASWRWVFYLNVPMGIIGAVLGFLLFENYRAPAPTRFDVGGFFTAAIGLFLFEFAIENLGRPIITPWVGELFFPISAAILYIYVRHARASPAPVLDLSLLKIKTFRIGTVTGGVCRMGLDATPFMLPLLFQVGFGFGPMQAGSLTFSSTLGAMLVRAGSRSLLRSLGFRRALICGALGAAAITALFALLSADTPSWIIVLCVLVSGCVRSIQYLALNTISFADVPSPLLSRSTSVSGVFQQLARGFGVALGAALLAVVAGGDHVSVGNFRIVFLLIAVVPLASVLGFLRLDEDDGAEVSGHASHHAAVEADEKAEQGAGE
jgi:MFS family permease